MRSKQVICRWVAAAGVATAVLASGCAMLAPKMEAFKAPPVGSTWTISQINTGSYGSGTARIVTTRDDNYLIIPNGAITKQNIINFHYPTRLNALKCSVGVEYGAAPNDVKNVLRLGDDKIVRDNAFTTTATADTVVITGTLTTDLFFVSLEDTNGAGIAAGGTALAANAGTDTLFVRRGFGGKSGAGYQWIRIRPY